jgi:hypothetical protein
MSQGSKFRRFHSPNRELVQLQSNIEAALSQFLVIPIMNGVLLENIELAVGDNSITHKLGRTVKGYIVTRVSAACDIYDKISTDTKLDQQFTLNSSSACTISIWVF